MADPPASPISQLLHTLGITREDLEKRSHQMRQFLTAENAKSSRVTDNNNPSKPSFTSISKPSVSTSSMTRSRSRASSFRDTTPPMTPVKTEATEIPLSLRHFDSMEMVIERQRRQSKREKKERRGKDREVQVKTTIPRPQSPSLGDASRSDSSHHDACDAQRVLEQGVQKEPVHFQGDEGHPDVLITPQRGKYYREHTKLSSDVQSASQKVESPTPNACAATTPQLLPQNFPYPQFLTYAHLLQPFPVVNGRPGASSLPVTPQSHRISTLHRASINSPLPPSSPPPVSSPISTPHRPHVNLVSSPGPMGPPLDEHDYDQLPFTLPPGPYSPNKPNASYAALVGQAILSSPERRLTLQEIYDWITIVYPYFKRGEQTWMNSIRHVLSTTVCFRKVTRDRTLGRTQWAIWDEDLECFQGGGFRKQLCKDFVNGTTAKDKQSSRGKGKGRKREDFDNGGEDRKAKRSKTDHTGPLPALIVSSSYTPATLSSHPLFRPTRPTPHHQPYYESCLQSQPLTRDIIFPPLPADVGYTRVPITSVIASTPASLLSSAAPADKIEVDVTLESPPSVLPVELPSSSSSSSIPELTISDSLSSSPPSALSEIDGDIRSTSPKDNASRPHISSIGSEHSIRNSTTFRSIDVPHDPFLIPMKDRSEVAYGHMLWSVDEQEVGPNDDKEHRLPASKALNDTRKVDSKALNDILLFPSVPISPKFQRKLSRPSQPPMSPNRRVHDQDCHPNPMPSTPPQPLCQLPTSSVRTPLSSKGINPAALSSEGDGSESKERISKTPRKRIPSSGSTIASPVTPRKLVFLTNQNTSPFRTPVGGLGVSPYRTPGSRGIFDPYDPGALLDEELNRMGTIGQGDSPAGLFGKGRGSLLYDSPGLSISPGRWW